MDKYQVFQYPPSHPEVSWKIWACPLLEDRCLRDHPSTTAYSGWARSTAPPGLGIPVSDEFWDTWKDPPSPSRKNRLIQPTTLCSFVAYFLMLTTPKPCPTPILAPFHFSRTSLNHALQFPSCGSKATVTVPPTATTTASSLQLPPDLQAGSIRSIPFCPFTPAFLMRRFFLLPQLLAAPLLAGSLFILPLSIAEAQESNNTVRNNEVHPLAEVAVGLLSGAGSVLTTVYFMSKPRLKKLEKIYEKTIKMDNDLKNLQRFNNYVTGKIEKIDNNNKLLVDIRNSNKDLNDSIQNLISKIDNDLKNLEKLNGDVIEKIEKVDSSLQKVSIEVDSNNKSLIGVKDSNKDLNDSIQNLNSKLDSNRQKILERINEIPSKIQSS